MTFTPITASIAFVAGAIAYAVCSASGCGGYVRLPGCASDERMCEPAFVCCPENSRCGDGVNGCDLGKCCGGARSDAGEDAP